MRHLWSLLAGVVSAPVVWLLLASGQYRAQAVVAGWSAAGRFDPTDLVGPVILLAVAGIVLGLLGTLRWSPAGPVAAGLLFVTPTVLMFAHPFQTLEGFFRPADASPRRVLAQDLAPWLPVENGTLLVLGALLLMAVFSSQRWRRWPGAPRPAAPAAARPATDHELIAGISALGGGRREPATTREPTPMTDDEILAAAAALDGLPAPARTAPDRPGQPAGEAPGADSGAASSGGSTDSDPD